MQKYLVIAAITLALFGHKARAETNIHELSFNAFLEQVLGSNMELIIEQYEVTAAEAALLAARVFDDPELEMIFPSFDSDEFSTFPRSIAFEMEIPIDIFGKRRNRVRQAMAEKHAAEAGLEDFLRHLRSFAAKTYVEVVTHQRILERMQLTLDQLNRLIEVNQALHEAGEVGEIDVLQTRLEARNFEAELYDVRADFSELMGDVHILLGGIPADSLVFTGDIEMPPPVVSYEDLRRHALENRPDVVMAKHHVEASHFAMREVRAERFPDISLVAGYHNEGALSPMPGFSAAYGGLIIPLKFSGINRGAFRESVAHHEQASQLFELVRLEAEAELLTAWESHLLKSQKRLLFSESILQDAERVRDAISFSYQRGEVSLLELLDAQRTMNEVYMNYYETLAQYAESIVRLSEVSGQWFVVLE